MKIKPIHLATALFATCCIVVFFTDYSSGGDNFMHAPYYTGGNARFYTRDNYGVAAVADYTAASANVWHTTRIIKDMTGQTLNIYLDGALQTHSADTSELADPTTLAGDINIGSSVPSGQTLWIDEITIWNASVTP